jgi:capsular exopolysaccharide synthesis family protein
MSKIYEALERAEQERTASGEGAGAPKTSSTLVDSPRSEPEAFAEPRPMTVDALAAPVDFATPAEWRSIEASSILSREWDPSFADLPALQESGAEVEQFRSLRSRMFEFRDLNRLKSIMVASGLPGEGKSYIAANLAVSFARHKSSRVLLIDGDMRRSSLHKLFGCSSEPGLADYLAGNATAQEVLQQGHAHDGQPLPVGLATLTVIPGGDGGDKAADLSGSERFGELLRTAESLFDWIVVDSSPVNLVADAVNLARACDGVLLIARSGVTPYQTVQRALIELKASKMLGVVLNAVKNPPLADGYYGYGNYTKKAD